MSGISGISLRGGESEMFRRSNNRDVNKQKRIRSIKLKGFHLVFILLAFLAAGFTAYKAGEFIMTWEKFRVDSFRLIDGPKLESEKLQQVLNDYNVNIFSLNFNELRNDLLTLRQVKDVALSRKLPSTIEIRFFLRHPAFQVMVAKNRYEVIDNEGVPLYTSQEKRQELVTIKHIRKKELDKIIPYLDELGGIKDSIDYVGIQSPYGLVLKLKGLPEIFYPGESNFTSKINNYLELKKRRLPGGGKIKRVDLRFKDRLYLEYEEESS